MNNQMFQPSVRLSFWLSLSIFLKCRKLGIQSSLFRNFKASSFSKKTCIVPHLKALGLTLEEHPVS